MNESRRALRPIPVCGLLLALTLVACGGREAPEPTATPFAGTPRPVIIDTDMATDDWMAILYLLRRPDVAVQAITVTGAGEAHCGPGVQHAHGLVALAGQPEIPVACGREMPLVGSHAFPAAWREAVDSLLGLELPTNPNPTDSDTAVEVLTTILSEARERVTLLTLGPLTNVAETLAARPDLVQQIEDIVIMGGAVEVPGNVGSSGVSIANQVAEWNIYVDPHAANLVLQSGAPVTLVPLDATNQVPLTSGFYDRLKREHTTPEASFVFDVLTAQERFIDSGGYYFWDPLAAAILVDESLATMMPANIVVVEAAGEESGRTVPSATGPEVRYATAVDGDAFSQDFLTSLNRP